MSLSPLSVYGTLLFLLENTSSCLDMRFMPSLLASSYAMFSEYLWCLAFFSEKKWRTITLRRDKLDEGTEGRLQLGCIV